MAAGSLALGFIVREVGHPHSKDGNRRQVVYFPLARASITAAPNRSRMAFRESSPIMEFTALFLAVTIVMIAAWRGPRTLALALFAVTLVACVATYLHHASTVLKLSF
jgi:hypothetical protein